MKIVLSLPHSPSNSYQAALGEEAVKTAATLGVKLVTFYGEGDNLKQWEHFTASIREGDVHAILCMPLDDSAIHPKITMALQAGILVGLLNRSPDYLSALRREFPHLPVFSVVPDQMEVGRIQARQVRKMLRGNRFLYLIDGTQRNWSSQQRLAGMREEGKYADSTMTIINGAWKSDKAYDALMVWSSMVLEKWVCGSRDAQKAALPKGVVLQSEGMYFGVRRALDELAKKLDLPEIACIPIMGCDGTLEFRKMVDEGILPSTVVLPTTIERAMQAAARWHRDKVAPPPQIVLQPKPYPPTSV